MKLEDCKAWLLQHGEIKEEYERHYNPQCDPPEYGLDVEIPTLLFPEDFMNDCFKEYTRWDEFCESDELCVRQYLRDVFPQYSRQDFLVRRG